MLLYDLTSTYFESPPPDDDADKRRHGYSRFSLDLAEENGLSSAD